MASSAAATKVSPILLEDTFRVTVVDPDGKKFIKVSRFQCESTHHANLTITVDINVDLYPIQHDDILVVALASTIELGGEMNSSASYDHSAFIRPTLMDSYEYVAHGMIYDCTTDNTSAADAVAYVSLGGLLMRVSGDTRYLHRLKLNEYVYLLIRKSR